MLDNWFYILPLIPILILLKLAKKKKFIYEYGPEGISKTSNYLPFLVINLYLISALLIFFARPEEWYPYFSTSSFTPLNFAFYSSFVFLYLLPVLYFQPLNFRDKLPSPQKLKPIFIIMSLLAWFSFSYQLPYALEAYALGAEDLRLEMNINKSFVLPNSSLTTVAVGISSFYLFFIFLFFVSLVQNSSFVVKMSMLVGSISYIVNGITFMTRDVFIFYPLGFLFIYLYIKKFLKEEVKRKITRFFIVLTTVAAIFLLINSYQRFSNNSRNELAYGTIGYLSQQPFVFSETVEKQIEFYNGHLRFPIFTHFINEERKIDRTIPYEWSFGTVVKDIYSEGGIIFLFIFTLIVVTIFIYKLRWSSKNNFYQKIIVTLFYFQFITEGLFYFKMGSRGGNLYMILLFVLYILSNVYSGKLVKK